MRRDSPPMTEARVRRPRPRLPPANVASGAFICLSERFAVAASAARRPLALPRHTPRGAPACSFSPTAHLCSPSRTAPPRRPPPVQDVEMPVLTLNVAALAACTPALSGRARRLHPAVCANVTIPLRDGEAGERGPCLRLAAGERRCQRWVARAQAIGGRFFALRRRPINVREAYARYGHGRLPSTTSLQTVDPYIGTNARGVCPTSVSRHYRMLTLDARQERCGGSSA